MNEDIFVFIKVLRDLKVEGPVFNHYAKRSGDDINRKRRMNLFGYLKQMRNLNPDTLLVGEAPGPKCCKITGIPFSSGEVVYAGIKEYDLFGLKNGYQISGPKYSALSCNCIWSYIKENFDKPPLLWNAYPYYPYIPNSGMKNRAPSNNEIRQVGRIFLKKIIEMYDIKKIIAVGNRADHALNILEFKHSKVRHPSHGGSNQFIFEMNQIFKK